MLIEVLPARLGQCFGHRFADHHRVFENLLLARIRIERFALLDAQEPNLAPLHIAGVPDAHTSPVPFGDHLYVLIPGTSSRIAFSLSASRSLTPASTVRPGDCTTK